MKTRLNATTKLTICLLSALALVACSSNAGPQASTLVLNTCGDAHDLVRSNHQKIEQAFANKDANTIGTLELENHAIVKANMECFPNMEEHIAQWKKMNEDMDQ